MKKDRKAHSPTAKNAQAKQREKEKIFSRLKVLRDRLAPHIPEMATDQAKQEFEAWLRQGIELQNRIPGNGEAFVTIDAKITLDIDRWIFALRSCASSAGTIDEVLSESLMNSDWLVEIPLHERDRRLAAERKS